MPQPISSKAYEYFHSVLIAVREGKDLTQVQVAERLGKPQSFVSKYERGERRLDVIEFLEVCEALGVDPHHILGEIQLNFPRQTFQQTFLDDETVRKNILDRWEITPYELTTLVDDNPSLRGILSGYVAELKFEKIWLRGSEVSSYFKHDDHSRRGKGDRVITYKGREFIIEVKSLQTQTVKRIGDTWFGRAQVDASDRRTVTLPDGSDITTTLLVAGEFDVLAVNIFEFEQDWRYVFAKNDDLPRSTYHGYTPEQQQYLLSSMVDVTWPPTSPFRANLYDILNEFLLDKD